jgi:alpha-methylacyl-CoA racemase
MMLADMGADVIRIDRKHAGESGLPVERRFEVMFRGKRSVAIDLKLSQKAIKAVQRMVSRADVLIEGFRPGVMERLGLAPEYAPDQSEVGVRPDDGLGWDGPLAYAPGHDLNYIALAGVLHAIGRKGGGPEIPLNLIGDFGGSSTYLAFGILCAVRGTPFRQGRWWMRQWVDGATSLMSMVYSLHAAGYWKDERGSNRLDSGAPWYELYETRDGKWVAVGATEHSFYLNTLKVLGLEAEAFGDQHDRTGWPAMKEAFARVCRTRTRDEWVAAFEGTEHASRRCCRWPRRHCTHISVRAATSSRWPALCSRRLRRDFPAAGRDPAPTTGGREHSDEVLHEWGFGAEEIASLREAGAI